MRSLRVPFGAVLFCLWLAGNTGADELRNAVTVAGTTSLGNSTANIQLLNPSGSGLAFDRAGNCYVGELAGQRIRKIDPSGVVTTLAGTGIAGFNGDGRPANETQVWSPHGFALEHGADGALRFLYFCDQLNRRVRAVDFTVLTSDGRPTVKTIAGTGALGSTGDGGLAVNATLNNPLSLALQTSADGTVRNLYIGDFNANAIRKVNLVTGMISRFDIFPLASAPALSGPNGITLETNPAMAGMWIAERSANRVRWLSASGTVIKLIATGDLVAPTGVARDAEGNLFVGERGGGSPDRGHRIFKISAAELAAALNPTSPKTVVIDDSHRVAGNVAGQGGYGGDGGSALDALLSQPVALTFKLSASGAVLDDVLYVNELSGQRVRAVDLGATPPTIATFAGRGIEGRPPAVLPATDTVVRSADSLAIDANGNVLVCENLGNRVRRLDPIAGTIVDVAGTGTPGVNLGDNGVTQAALALIRNPDGIAFLGGELLVGERDGVQLVPDRIRSVGASGLIEAFFTFETKGAGPRDVAVDAATNDVYVSIDNNRQVRRLSLVAGSWTQKWSVTLPAAIGAARGLVVGPDETGARCLFAAVGPETAVGNGDVHKLRLADGADLGSIIGAPTGLTSVAGIDLETQVDGSGTKLGKSVLVCDKEAYLLRRIDLATRTVSVVAGTTAGFLHDGESATETQLATPSGVRVDPAGNIYISEMDGHRIRRLDVAVNVHFCPDETDPARARATISFLDPSRTPEGVDLASITLQVLDEFLAADGTPLGAGAPKSSRIPCVVAPSIEGGELVVRFDLADFDYLLPGRLRLEGRFVTRPGSPVGQFFSGDAYFASKQLDTTPPTLVCPATASIAATGPTTPLYGIATATDECDPAPRITYTPAALPYVFPEVPQTVQVTATDASGNVSAPSTVEVTVQDRTPPSIVIAAPADGDAYVLGASVAALYTVFDELSGVASVSVPVANGGALDTSTVGAKTFTVSATDRAGNAASATAGYAVVYAPAGTLCLGEPSHAVLSPIRPDVTFQQGRTVPAKFRVCDANGASIGTPDVVSSFNLVKVIDGAVVTDVREPVASTTGDADFRWDPTSQLWIFDISTKDYLAGRTYVFEIALNDGTTIEFQLDLR
jgi:sugar lactone lactonase YvrE